MIEKIKSYNGLIIIDDNNITILKLLEKEKLKYTVIILIAPLEQIYNNIFSRPINERRYTRTVIFEVADLFKYDDTCIIPDIVINYNDIKKFLYLAENKIDKLIKTFNLPSDIATGNENIFYNL